MSQRILMAAFLFLVVGASGCRTTPTLVEAPPHVTAKVAGDPEQIWTATRDVLLDQKLQIYVRDKRGMFIAYTPMKRFLIFFPRRTKLTVTLREESPGETVVAVETIRQHYRVTLLTYPDWRDVPGETDPNAGQELLDAIVAHVGAVETGP